MYNVFFVFLFGNFLGGDKINSKDRIVKENDTLSVILVIKGLNFLMY